MTPAFHRLNRRGAVVALKALLSLSALVLAGEASASERGSVPGPIVALTFDYGSKSLLLATRHNLYRRVESSNSWQMIDLPRSLRGSLNSVAVSAQPPHTIYLSNTARALLRSFDGGVTWKDIASGLPRGGITAISPHADRNGYAYAYVKNKGVFRSGDHGVTWRMMDKGPGPGFDHFVHTNMPGSMESGWLFAATSRGLYRAMDCFCGWHQTGTGLVDVDVVAFNRDRPEQIFVGLAEGIARSDDGGETFISLANGPVESVSMVAAPAGRLYVARRDSVLVSSDSGLTWSDIND